MSRIYENSLKHKEITDKIIKGFYEVYNKLGEGFLESVYENALFIVLKEYGLEVEKQKGVHVNFRNQVVGEFKPDLIVENKIII